MPFTCYMRARVPLPVPRLLLPFLLLIPLFSGAQLKTISGTVIDETNAPVPAVTVIIKNTNTGTKTNSKGQFTLSAAAGSVLVFTSTTYETMEVPVDDRTEYPVTLKLKVSSMADVVVVGYGRQKKVNLVGAVGTVNVDDKITTRSLPNVSAGLSGLVPGLAATQSTGMAGRNGANLLIRGLGTVNNSNPLIVVDGMPDVDINRINVNDIETISVLKDATSASVYGSRAANGVILITTRTGKGGRKTAINLNTNMALEKPVKAYSFMADYPRALTLEQRRAATNTLPANQTFKNGTIDQWMALGMIDPVRYPNTDWWNVIIRDGSYQNYNLSASGGNDKSNFFASVGMRDEAGLQINNDYKQFNARFNFDYKVRNNMNTGVKFNGNWSKITYALEEGFTDSDPNNTAGTDMQYAIAGILPYDPTSGKYGGVMAYGEDPQAYNPYTLYVNSLNRQNRQEANVMMYYDWTPIKGLTGTIDYALNYYNQFAYNANMPNQAFNFQTGTYGSRVYVGPNAGISNNTATGYKTMMNGRVNYHTTINANHEINALFVYSEEYWYDRLQGSSRNDRLFPGLSEVDAALTGIVSSSGSSNTEGLRSYIGRLNYTAFNKYLLEGNFRVDGSSKFLPGHQYGFFPSVALGWRFTEEKFINKFTDKFLTNGKLRVSYGGLGNNSGVGRYEQQPTLATNLYMINGSVTRGFVNSKLMNTDLSWEKTSVFNAGLELAFLNNRLTAELDYYDRLTTGMNRPSDLSIMLSGAYNPPRKNIGNLRNRGIEGNFTWKDNIRTLNYAVTVNASYNKTRLEKWNEYIGRGSANSGANIFVDMPYNYVYAYEAIGIAQTWEDIYNNTPQGAQPGDILRKDINGDGRIDANDMRAYSNFTRDRPSTYVTLSGYASWKGFDMAFMVQGSYGRKDFWLNAFNNTNFSTARYASTWDHWYRPWSWDNRSGDWPRLGGSGNNQATGTTGAGMSTFWLDNMSFIRLKNVQLGYSLPKKLIGKAGISSLRIAGTAENLGTITKYRGLDPEKTGSNNNMYPLVKSYALSVQLGL
ncbi:SusC/RagA family TonB-linked outer membrane protein [Niastella vici]|uniref:SusC/RagA family TonB-linked outer membrane protein n=1 Tax=Niastella vici TaxID=1703345 RepID=A0A1V9G0Y6_9BACT|nr:TonB-dependent receptor [Niastella vici]OQP64299.1 SusC/RagA family TonB-linked outer membrane protein [Niastella vici]